MHLEVHRYRSMGQMCTHEKLISEEFNELESYRVLFWTWKKNSQKEHHMISGCLKKNTELHIFLGLWFWVLWQESAIQRERFISNSCGTRNKPNAPNRGTSYVWIKAMDFRTLQFRAIFRVIDGEIFFSGIIEWF